jgi:tetratricopeptide (TPR) repeat protein
MQDLSDGAMPEDYVQAVARGVELFKVGEYDRSIRMFELAQTLPGEEYDYKSKIAGGANAQAPTVTRTGLVRYTSTAQNARAQYNIACVYVAMGDVPQALELLREYVDSVQEPVEAIDGMLKDEDLIPVRAEISAMRGEYEEIEKQRDGPFRIWSMFGRPLDKAVRKWADTVGVEIK